MSVIINELPMSKYGILKNSVRSDETKKEYVVSGIVRPEFMLGFTSYGKFEIQVFRKGETVFEDIFSENNYFEFMEQLSDMFVNIEDYENLFVEEGII